MAEHPRTQSARDHDDKDIIKGMIPAGDATPSSAGGRLAQDIGSQADLKQVDDPDGTTGAEKQNKIDSGVAQRSDRGATSE